MSYKHQLLKLKFIRSLSSVRLTVTCLFLLYLLTFFGTIAQIHEGLYLAQQRYFESIFFLAFGFLPFPGAQAVMWVLFANLICVALTRFVYQWQRVGIIIIHSGLMLFLVSGYMTLHSAQESYLTLSEGQASNVTRAYHDWEISVWEAPAKGELSATGHDVLAFDANRLKPEQKIVFHEAGFQLTVKEFYKNCESYEGENQDNVLNASGIVRLQPTQISKEPEKNTPGGIFILTTKDNKAFNVLLYGGESRPMMIDVGPKKYNLILRFKRYPLPFTLKLKKFKKEEHPGTDMARSFQSLVEIQIDKAWREKLISMNEPLRYKDFTLYQASFTEGKGGELSSTLAVVKNAGRLMPYISTFVTVLGLVIHFSMMAVRSKKNPRKKENHE